VAAVLLGTQTLNPFFYAGLGITLLVTATILAASHILNLGKYDKYPTLKWVLGVGLALTTFSIAASILGFNAINPFFYAGLGTTLLVAGTIVGVAKILSKGNYAIPGFASWALSVALLYSIFTPIILILGTVGVAAAALGAIFGDGANPFKQGRSMMKDIARTIVDVAGILSKGKFEGGPKKEWAEGVGIAIGAFAPVYDMLVRSSIFKAFGMSGVGPTEFKEAIEVVVGGIVAAAKSFADADAAFKNPPTEEWARGVGLAIGAFAPVYEILAANSGWFSSGVSAEDFAGKFDDSGKLIKDGAIQVIARGIVSAAKFFAGNTAPFEEGKYPSKEWGEGVGAALGAFAPVFKALNEDTGWFTSGDDVIKNMTNGITKISESIVTVAKKFGGVSPEMWESYPKLEWARSIHDVVKRFLMTIEMIKKNEDLYSDLYRIGSLRDSMIRLAKKLYFNRKYFEDIDYIDSFNRKVISTSTGILIKYHRLNRMLRFGKSLYGVFGESPATRTARSLVKMARILHGGKEAFSLNIDPNYMKNVGQNMLDFNELVKKLVESESEGSSFFGRMGESISSLFGLDPISQIANRMVTLAKGYDAMATALIKLSTAMKMLNVNSGAQLGGFTKSLISGEEIKASGGQFKEGEKKMTKLNVGGKSESGVKLTKDEQKKNSILYVSEKLEELITIMQNINKNTETVDEALEELTKGKIKAAPNIETTM